MERSEMTKQKSYNEIDKNVIEGNISVIKNLEAIIEHLKRANLRIRSKYELTEQEEVYKTGRF